MEASDSNEFQFELNLHDVFRSLSYYVPDEEGVQQLKFDPPVYQSRYSVIVSILKKKEWIPHIKKVFKTLIIPRNRMKHRNSRHEIWHSYWNV